MKPKSNPSLWIYLFFSSYLILGTLIFRNYGTSIDEPVELTTSHRQYKVAVSKLLSLFAKTSTEIGEVQYNQNILSEHRDRYYGTFVSWPTVAIEHFYHFTLDNPTIYQIRHYYNFLTFFSASIALYLLLYQRFKSKSLAILGPMILILSPRFFAEAFYNNKDILFFCWYLFSLLASYFFLKKSSFIQAIIAGFIFGITINTRIIGLILPAIVICLQILRLFITKPRHLAGGLTLLTLLLTTWATYIFTSPTAWGHELSYLPKVFSAFKSYDWTGDTLYFGRLVPYNQAPWHFIPGYLLVTTPILYSLLAIAGLFGIIKTGYLQLRRSLSDFFKSAYRLFDTLMLLALVGPLLAVIVLKPVIYNSWRHLYFIYGPFIYLCVWTIASSKKYQKTLASLYLIAFAITGTWMVKNHPYQYAYFNPVFQHTAYANFERDYWGVATLDLIDYILKTDPRPQIVFSQTDYALKAINFMLSPSETAKFSFTDNPDKADYQIYQYYNSTELLHEIPGFVPIKTISVDDNSLMTLYQNSQY